MHNWWIAALEEFGLVTREEAEHMSQEIKLTIHKERYKEALDELQAILGNRKITTQHIIEDLQSDIANLKSEVEKLKEVPEKKVASKK